MNRRVTHRRAGNRGAIVFRTAAIRADSKEGGDYAYR